MDSGACRAGRTVVLSLAARDPSWRPGEPVPVPRLLSAVTWLSLAIAALTVMLFLAVPGLREGRDLPILAAIGLLLGTPHGVVDHLLPQSDRWPLRGRALSRLLSVYVVVVAVVLAVTLITPVLGIGLVILFSVVHFGSTDAAMRCERRGRAPCYGPVVVLAYGGSLGFVSFARWPNHVRDIFSVISPDIAGSLRVPMFIAAGCTVVAIFLFTVTAVRHRDWLDVVEVWVLLAMAVALPPLAAFGVYFTVWHSLRQYVRLYGDARGNTGSDARMYPSPRTLNRRSLFLTMAAATAATVVLFVAAIIALRMNIDIVYQFRLGDWLIVLLAAVIIPHTIALLRYDRWKAIHHSEKRYSCMMGQEKS